MDADFQHPPESIRELVSELINGNDMAIGVREDKFKLSFTRKWASIAAQAMAVSYLYAIRQPTSRDIMSGFFAGRSDLCKKVIEEKSDKFERAGFKGLFRSAQVHAPRHQDRGGRVQVQLPQGGRVELNSRVNRSIIRQWRGRRKGACLLIEVLHHEHNRTLHSSPGAGTRVHLWFLGLDRSGHCLELHPHSCDRCRVDTSSKLCRVRQQGHVHTWEQERPPARGQIGGDRVSAAI